VTTNTLDKAIAPAARTGDSIIPFRGYRGTGTDVAVESAGVVLMSGDLRGVVNAVAVSRAVDKAIAPAARTGDSIIPFRGYSTPAATGTRATL
jgi:hypothetical protein